MYSVDELYMRIFYNISILNACGFLKIIFIVILMKMDSFSGEVAPEWDMPVCL